MDRSISLAPLQEYTVEHVHAQANAGYPLKDVLNKPFEMTQSTTPPRKADHDHDVGHALVIGDDKYVFTEGHMVARNPHFNAILLLSYQCPTAPNRASAPTINSSAGLSRDWIE